MHKILRFMVLFLLGSLLVSCGVVEIGMDFDYEEFLRQKAAWEAVNPVDYQFEYYSPGFLTFHELVVVRDGALASSRPLHEDSILRYDESLSDVFDRIESYYLDGRYRVELFPDIYTRGITLEYDPDYHFITAIWYDDYIRPGVCVDGSYIFQYRNFLPLDQ